MKTPFLILFTCLCLRVFAQEPATDISTADIASMESRQAGLRLAASPLCDAEAHARGLVAAYRTLWRGWCLSLGNQSVIEAHRQS